MDYLDLSLQAMIHLNKCGKPIVLYELARGLGINREDSLDSLFPVQGCHLVCSSMLWDFQCQDHPSGVVKIIFICFSVAFIAT